MSLRPLLSNDLEMMLEWRNVPEVRKCMYASHVITLEEHRAWFERIENRADCRWFIYKEGKSENPSGVVYLNNISKENRSAFWGFYGGIGAAKGVGFRMLSEALDYAFEDLMLHKINSEILSPNKKSIYLHGKLGFSEEGIFRDFHFDGVKFIDVIRMGLLEEEWARRRDEILGGHQ